MIILFAIYATLFLGLYLWCQYDRKRDQRREDLARVDSICRHWKSMDQPRDKKTGRWKEKAKA